MHTNFWFNRLIEYWTLPTADQVVEHVRRGKVQVVQMGNFGPDFYGLAGDEKVERSWRGCRSWALRKTSSLPQR